MAADDRHALIVTTRLAKAKRLAVALLAAIGWFALLLQYVLLVVASAPDIATLEIMVRYVSYFTIQANMLAVLVLTAFVIKAGREEWLVQPFVRSAVAVYMSAVGLIY